MAGVTATYLNQLVQQGSLTTALAAQEAAAQQENNATTGSLGADTTSSNQSWGKSIPVLIGHTQTVALPVWLGTPLASIQADGTEVDTIDFAAIIGRKGPSATGATLSRVWFDNVLVYDASDASVLTLHGDVLQFTFYDGTQSTPDPTIQAKQGVQTPAWHGTMYIVFTNLFVRSVDPVNTISQFTALPEVMVEVLQVSANIAHGATIYPFNNNGQKVPAGVDNFLLPGLGRYYVLGLRTIATYNIGNDALLGVSPLQRFGTGKADEASNINNPYTMTLDGYFVSIGNAGNYYVWDPTTGRIIASAKLDSGFLDIGQLTDVGNGYLLLAGLQACKLIHFDGTTLTLCNMDGISAQGGYNQTDTITNFANMPNFKASSLAYQAVAANNLRRLIITTGGDKNKQMQVAKITYDGSNRPIFRNTALTPILTLTNENIICVMLDNTDTRFVYCIVETAAGQPQLRTYATFEYWNPQNGGVAPLTTPAIAENYDLLVELSRVDIPVIEIVNAYNGFQYRDKRFAHVGYSNVTTYVVLNFKTGTFVQFVGGDLFDAGGDDLGPQNGWPTKGILLGGDDVIVTYQLAAPNTPARMIPRGSISAEAPYTLAQMYTDLTTLAGYDLSDITCINMDDTITGVQLNQSVLFTDLMAQLNATFRVDMIEEPDSSLVYDRRIDDRSADYTITPDLLLPASDDTSGNTLAIDRVATNELPSILQLAFIDENFGFVVGSASAKRVTYPAPTIFGNAYLSLSIPVVMSAADANYYAGIALFDMWAGKANFQVNLPPMFFYVEPGDFVALVRPSGRVTLCKVTEISLGADMTIAVTLSAVSNLKPVPYWQSAATAGQGMPAGLLPSSFGTFTTPSPTGVRGTVVDNIGLDAQDLTDADLPLYIAVSAVSDVYLKFFGAPPVLFDTVQPSVLGVVVQALPAEHFPHQYQPNASMTLTLVNAGDAIPATQLVLVGAPGRWEAVGFDTATIAAGVVTLTGLRRGRLGTDPYTGGSLTGDVAIFAPLALRRASLPLSSIGQAVTVFAMPQGSSPGARGGIEDKVTMTGASLLPRAPTRPAAQRQANGDVVLSWYRQDRATPADFYADPPMSEASLAFTLTLPTIIAGGASSRNVVVGATTYTYPAADQATDGTATATRLYLTIAQNSAVVGPGTPFQGYVIVQS